MRRNKHSYRFTRAQRGKGFGRFLKLIPLMLKRTGRFAGKSGIRTGKKALAGSKVLKSHITKKNLQKIALGGAAAAGTGAISAGAQHLVRKLLG